MVMPYLQDENRGVSDPLVFENFFFKFLMKMSLKEYM